jgi:hypothetical protein
MKKKFRERNFKRKFLRRNYKQIILERTILVRVGEVELHCG